MRVKFVDLSYQFKRLKKPFMSQVEEICRSTSFVGGEYVRAFEKAFAKFIGVSQCVGVGNGTDALEIALRALKLPIHKNEVILPANTFFASLESVLNANYTARIIDCGEDYLLDFNALKQILDANGPSIGAIMPVHLYGQMCDMESLRSLAKPYNIAIIEDASQAHGSRDINGHIAGSKGDIACFSFYPSKNLGAFGDGGAIVGNNSDLIAFARALSNHGVVDSKYEHEFIGRNSRLDSLQAAALSLKLPYLNANNTKRVRLAQIYHQHLSDIDGVYVPQNVGFHIYHLYILRLSKHLCRDKLRRFLYEKGIETSVHYPYSLADFHFVRLDKRVKLESTPRAIEYAKHIVSLPLGEHLQDKHIAYVCEAIKAFVKQYS